MQIEQIAELAHEVNRAYCEAIGEAQLPAWNDAPSWQRAASLGGVRFCLRHLSAGPIPSPSLCHKAWAEEKRTAGWTYGPVKDPAKKEHPCLVPYDQLPVEQRVKDYLFVAVVKTCFDMSGGGNTDIAESRRRRTLARAAAPRSGRQGVGLRDTF